MPVVAGLRSWDSSSPWRTATTLASSWSARSTATWAGRRRRPRGVGRDHRQALLDLPWFLHPAHRALPGGTWRPDHRVPVRDPARLGRDLEPSAGPDTVRYLPQRGAADRRGPGRPPDA